MDRLEAVEVRFSDIGVDNEKFRFDSEFFQKYFVQSYFLVKSRKYTELKNIVDTLTDFHANGSYESIAANFTLLDEPNYAYMVRSTDLEAQNYTNSVKYITKPTYDFLAKSKIYGGELLINKIGSPGRAYLMPHLNRPISLGMNLFMVRLNKNASVNNTVLWLFLNTKLGINIIERKINGTVPLTIDKAAIKSLPIPIFSSTLQELLSKIVANSEQMSHKSQTLYAEAENLLLSELGLLNYTPTNKAVSIKSLTSSFGTSGRLDAEYYQPKYENVLKIVKSTKHKTLGKLVDISKSIEPGSECYGNEGIPFVRISNLTKFGISDPDIKIPRDTVANIERLYPAKDTILLTKDGSVGIAYKLEEDMVCVTSGALLHLKVVDENEILADYLALALNSLIVQMQAERDAGGSIIQHWKPSEIEQVVIPLLPIATQQQISEKIQQSFAMRKQSTALLEKAKLAVEMAIEQGEDVAMKWLEE